MGKKLTTFLSILGRYKYIITIVIGVAYVGFIDDNSFYQRVRYDMQISDLKADIQRYNDRNEADNVELNSIKHNPKAIERIARERYFMKADDEDIFVLSTDKPMDNTSNKINLPDEATK